MWFRIYFADTDADLTPNYGNIFTTACHMDNIARTAKNYIYKRGVGVQFSTTTDAKSNDLNSSRNRQE